MKDKPERLTPRGRPKALTNREYFAGVAFGLIFSKNYPQWNEEEIKKEAYRLADFLIEE
jgi:hypothetical protein